MASFARWSLAAALLLCACTSSRYSVETGRERPRHVAEYLREERAEHAQRNSGALERAQLFAARRLPAGERELQPQRWFQAEQRLRQMQRHVPGRGGLVAKDASLKGAPQWQWLGPANVTGRTRTLEFDPRDSRVLYAGGVSGGVWKSVDAGASWQPLSDDAVNLNIGALAIDPQQPDTLYAGTGELYRDSGMPWSPMSGSGILKSVDGGVSWSPLLATQNADFRYVSDIVFSPTDSRRLYAATNSGVWRSRDGGATFERLLRPASDQDLARYEGCTDLAIRADTAQDWLLATCASRSTADRYWLPGTVTPPACGGPCPAAIFLNTDAGNDGQWRSVLSEAGQGRTQIDIHRADPRVVYAVAASIAPGFDRDGDGHGDYDNGLHALWRSDDGGQTWQARLRNDSPDLLSASLFHFHFAVNPRACNDSSPPDFYGAGWYNNAIAADPVDADTVWVGGMTLFRSTDGGRRFSLASYYFAQDDSYVHPDQHRIRFHPDYDGASNQRIYSTHDGGISVSDNARAPLGSGDAALCQALPGNRVRWRDLSRGMGTTQFYAGAVFPDGSRYFGGTQDNGTWLGGDAAGPYAWRHIYGGDGGFAAVNPVNTNVLYATAQYISLGKSTNGGNSFADAVNGLADQTLFIMPYLIDPNAPDRLYAGGLRLWRSDDGAGRWRPASARMGGSAFGNRISAIAVAPGNPDRMLVGNQAGIFRNQAALASTATTEWASAAPRAGWVSRLAFDPLDSNIAYATYSTFGGNHVWKSSDGGASWQPLDGSGEGALPDVPVHAIAINPRNTRELYLGTDLGLFVSLDGGAHWAVENTGFANVITEDLKLVAPAGQPPRLFAFTYGRGVWRVDLGDFDGAADYRIDSRIAGMWWNPQQDGHGLMLEPLAIDGVTQVLISWFVYQDGEPYWLLGVGRADGGRVKARMTASRGANFPPAFRSADVQREDWGEVELEFTTPRRAILRWNGVLPGFGSGETALEPLALAALPADDPPGAQLRACHSGNWFQPEQSGHGFFLHVTDAGGVRQLLGVWYVFDRGKPLFLVGAGPVQGDSATLTLGLASGPDFPPDHDPATLQRRTWGTATVRFSGNDTARISWTPQLPGFSAGSLDLVRLTAPLGRRCD
ncbi:hypothetical protein [Tahibacter harae]|uniref:Sortilin (Neurotensin receptor 3) n=1 Tax=Tahibacter harae TaxID=2963937 RepID=A0ABT1QZF4_9GAMM|nr:hypothetical protein [Tahibacter harae]MCQ4167630.1 hypothetical protein [Tahibacter harae]